MVQEMSNAELEFRVTRARLVTEALDYLREMGSSYLPLRVQAGTHAVAAIAAAARHGVCLSPPQTLDFAPKTALELVITVSTEAAGPVLLVCAAATTRGASRAPACEHISSCLSSEPLAIPASKPFRQV